MANDDVATAVIAAVALLGAGLGRLLVFDPFTQDYKQAAIGSYILGADYIYGANKFKLCKEVENAVVPADGDIAFHDDSGVVGEVTTDYSENLADLLRPVGAYVNAPADGDHFFLLVKGYHPDVNNTGADTITAGLDLIATAVDHGLVVAGARTLAASVGIAAAADVDGTDKVAVRLNCEVNW